MIRLPAPPLLRAVILDMDGLVLDSEPAYCEAWRRAAAEFGVELTATFCANLFGRHADDVESAIRGAIGDGYDRRKYFQAAEGHWRDHLAQHGVTPMPGLDILLDLFRHRNIPYAVATNSDGPYARESLRQAGLEAKFPLVVTRDQVARGKPAPDLFLEAARRLRTPPDRCLVLEDSATGLAAGIAAGTLTVLVQPREITRQQLADQALAAFPSLGEVAAWIAAGMTAAD